MCDAMCYTVRMMVSVTLSYDEEIKQWAAWIPDVAAYGAGGTMEEAVVDLKKAIALYIEEAGQDKFLAEIAPPAQLVNIPLESLVS